MAYLPAMAGLLLSASVCGAATPTDAQGEATPTSSSATAALPNGVTVELRSIAPGRWKEGDWISPMGTAIVAPYTTLEANYRGMTPESRREIKEYIEEIRRQDNSWEFAFTLQGLKNPSQPVYAVSFAGSLPFTDGYTAVYSYNEATDHEWWTHTTLIAGLHKQPPANRVNLRVTLGSGEYAPQASVPIGTASTVMVDGSPVILQKPTEVKGCPHFDVEYDGRVQEVRIRAVSLTGKEFDNAGNAGAASGPAQDPAHPGFYRDQLDLSELKLKDIDHLVIRSRKVSFVEFQDVPLTRDAATATGPKVVAGPVGQAPPEKNAGAMHLTVEPDDFGGPHFAVSGSDAVRLPAIGLLSESQIQNWTHPPKVEFVAVGTTQRVHFFTEVLPVSDQEKNRRMPADVVGMLRP